MREEVAGDVEGGSAREAELDRGCFGAGMD